MINNLYIRNFKSLKEVDLKLSNLNILTGLNGSGKSSLIQVLLLLRQNKYSLKEGKLKLNMPNNSDELFNAGLGEDVYYRYGDEPQISFKLDFFTRQTLFCVFNYVKDVHKNYDYLEMPLSAADIFSNGNHEFKRERFDEKSLETLALFNDNFQYLYAEREIPRDFYIVSIENTVKKKNLGIKGEYTASYLEILGTEKQIKYPELRHPKAENDNLIIQVNAWLSEISPDVNVDTKLSNNSQYVELRYKFGTNFYKPKNVGFGLSYVLPIIVALLTAEKGKLIIIENPESHVHPRGQAELGKLMAAAAQAGAQLIIETHSDHILNGIRVAVKENLVNKDKVSIFFHDRIQDQGEQYSKITSILIDNQGELSEYPDNFLDEWSNQLFKLV